ncbi:UNVERIFIED_CONTAM: hypothetical protein GTU68_048541 [Idotea baltica]|nr:hypothetical protein [Idotea baltica]
MFQLEIQNESASSLPDEAWLSECATIAYQGEGVGSVVLRVVDADEAKELNHAYRDKDYATNILSFPSEDEAGYLGDLVVCADVVKKEAEEQCKTTTQHWAHLVIHGMLHLQGYDHIEEEEATEMESLEVILLEKIGVPDPYNETNAR